MASNTSTNQKRSYAVPCASAFRDVVFALAQSRKVNVGDLARSVLPLVTRDVVAKYPDPGEPTPDDREQVVLTQIRAERRQTVAAQTAPSSPPSCRVLDTGYSLRAFAWP